MQVSKENIFFLLLKSLMSFSNTHHYLIILIISSLFCYYFIYISFTNSHQELFSINYRQCYQSNIQWSYKYKSSISYHKQLINSLSKYLLDTCDEITYLFTINIFYRFISFIHFLIFIISLWIICKRVFQI